MIRVRRAAGAIHVRDHRVFEGAYDPDAAPTNLIERVVRALPAIKKALPAGDFRPWLQIDTWARRIATDLKGATIAG